MQDIPKNPFLNSETLNPEFNAGPNKAPANVHNTQKAGLLNLKLECNGCYFPKTVLTCTSSAGLRSEVLRERRPATDLTFAGLAPHHCLLHILHTSTVHADGNERGENHSGEATKERRTSLFGRVRA